MDKNTIKENKREFDFWLEDGEVLYRYKNEEHHSDLGWMKMSDGVNFFSSNCIYIMNDSAVEFRKAIVDGKKIEFRTLVEQDEKSNVDNDVYEWKVLNICNKKDFAFNENLSDYRIAQ